MMQIQNVFLNPPKQKSSAVWFYYYFFLTCFMIEGKGGGSSFYLNGFKVIVALTKSECFAGRTIVFDEI